MNSLTAAQIRDQVASGKIKPTEVVAEQLKRIRQADPKVKAYLTVMEAEATAAAQALEKKITRKEPLGPLAGVPVAVKDNMCTVGVKTTCASKFLQNFVPPYDATVVKRLKDADAILIGKTNMDEFAMGSSTENSAFHPTHNPYDLERSPGGSSGGSAAAVAAYEACVALGSDTGGSIRQPAALTGTVGMKPTYGMVSRYGLVAFASSLDQIGPLTRTVADAALMMDVIAGHDPMDSTSVDRSLAPGSFSKNLSTPLKNIRIGVPREYFAAGSDLEVLASVRASLKVFEGMGACLEDVSLSMTEHAIAAYYIVAPSEASSNLGRYEGVHFTSRAKEFSDLTSMMSRSRDEGFGPEVKRRIMLGTYALSSGYYEAYYLRALKVRRLIQNDFDRVFEKVDFIVGPTSPIPAFKIGEKASDPLQMYLCDIFTVSANLAGIPGISLPCGYTKSGLPIGAQIMGKAFADTDLLRVAHQFEMALNLKRMSPAI